ncbi:hypothetical protein EC973_000793 [Apophysomyces ossiformis]|uniref:Reticulon domain-containing protein n=1 Tax=Apophysomyces ossiformis TaxID=679940 RepID=A0A8H7BQ70_9FUNG|nr:hypothetical protein EC973_000793 [Apophysomyces ossiformis]
MTKSNASTAVVQDIHRGDSFKARVTSLIYWDIPARSATVLASLLGGLILTQYYSLLYLGTAAFTVLTGINWIYVNLHQQGQKVWSGKSADAVIHPHSERFRHPAFISRSRMERIAKKTVDMVEWTLNELLKLVLVEDSWRSGCAIFISYITWTLAKYLATKIVTANPKAATTTVYDNGGEDDVGYPTHAVPSKSMETSYPRRNENEEGEEEESRQRPSHRKHDEDEEEEDEDEEVEEEEEEEQGKGSAVHGSRQVEDEDEHRRKQTHDNEQEEGDVSTTDDPEDTSSSSPPSKASRTKQKAHGGDVGEDEEDVDDEEDTGAASLHSMQPSASANLLVSSSVSMSRVTPIRSSSAQAMGSVSSQSEGSLRSVSSTVAPVRAASPHSEASLIMVRWTTVLGLIAMTLVSFIY